MRSLSEENIILRQALVIIKNLSPREDISVAQAIARNTTDKIPYRDPETGDEEELCKQEIKN